MKRQNSISMAVVNAHAAGIDVGSRQHYVAVGQEPADVRTFNVYTKDHAAMVEWLQQKGIVTVALESTGTYWQTLFSSLQAAGFDVVLSNNYIKDPQRKTDTKDARWLQKMHTLGLLKHSFIPSADIAQLRSYHRHRSNIVASGTSTYTTYAKSTTVNEPTTGCSLVRHYRIKWNEHNTSHPVWRKKRRILSKTGSL